MSVGLGIDPAGSGFTFREGRRIHRRTRGQRNHAALLEFEEEAAGSKVFDLTADRVAVPLQIELPRQPFATPVAMLGDPSLQPE